MDFCNKIIPCLSKLRHCYVSEASIYKNSMLLITLFFSLSHEFPKIKKKYSNTFTIHSYLLTQTPPTFMSFAMQSPLRLFMFSCILQPDNLERALQRRNSLNFFILVMDTILGQSRIKIS